MATIGQNFGLPLGDMSINATAVTLTGTIDKDRMLDRIVFSSYTTGAAGAGAGQSGVVTSLRVGGQNLLQSDGASFPIEMIGALSDDDGAFIGCPLKGGLSCELVATIDAAADSGAVVFTSDLPEGVSATPDEEDYNFIFPMGSTGVVGALSTWTLSATARRRVTLGRVCIVSLDGAADYTVSETFVTSITVAGSEILSGSGQIPCYGLPTENTNPFGPHCNDSDGLRIDLSLEAGESVSISGTSTPGCANIRAGIFLED
tara:strand:+ start:233 stop:1012 length:780 start_codon:yes stop_codon:yes gene_type:complete